MKSSFFRNLFSLSSQPVGYIEQFGAFGVAIIEYAAHKFDQLIWLIHVITLRNIEFLINIKFKTAARFIWSQGRFGKRFKYIFVILFSFSIYLAGGIFQETLVNPSTSSGQEFLGRSSSIIYEKASAATYRGAISLLDGPIEHSVESGETLDAIGKKYGISSGSIKYANNLISNSLRVGQILKIPPFDGTLHQVKKGDTIESLSKKYNVPTQTIVDGNYLDAPYELTVGQTLAIPEAELPESKKFYAGASEYDISAYGVIPKIEGVTPGSGTFSWPISGIITQGFHSGHPAIDIANSGDNVLASDKGTVVRAGWWTGGYGNAVQIDHGNGYVTTYAHMSSIAVTSGQNVEKGQKIGVAGSTGRSTGPHVHFTIQQDGKYLNPFLLLPN